MTAKLRSHNGNTDTIVKKATEYFPEFDQIKSDIESLKGNVGELALHIRSNGAAYADDLGKLARHELKKAKAEAQRELKQVEQYIQDKPTQSMAIAFIGGLVVSLFLCRR